jgi:dethiobiotin synthetase
MRYAPPPQQAPDLSQLAGLLPLPSAVFITGTDTDVGKTYITACLALQALKQGQRVAVYKPVQTGVASPEKGDAAWVQCQVTAWAEEAGLSLAEGQLHCETGFRFLAPAAPSVADLLGELDETLLLKTSNRASEAV